ncbi:hypothetical protein KL86PLE_60338 [uncultured Pleomorphomonas sp.]|uniref:Transposase n=1 Tax=uncultured Pleomorphomonas sp. TaxID=442121 RepID=A0A212L3A7_9HYPH|nr:hypothetical protein KL86PLE_100408 [uncultured Pleomorphomonas sp.]SCM78020.1 hypothetical protein KL86PLE_60338 [uncultured Pleomorphomonas sp.]
MAAHRHAPLQTLSLIYGCFARHQALVEPARSLPQGKANQKGRRRHQTKFGGARRDRTDDLKLAKLALSQLSYGPNSVTLTTPGGIGWPEWTRTTDLTLIRRVL